MEGKAISKISVIALVAMDSETFEVRTSASKYSLNFHGFFKRSAEAYKHSLNGKMNARLARKQYQVSFVSDILIFKFVLRGCYLSILIFLALERVQKF